MLGKEQISWNNLNQTKKIIIKTQEKIQNKESINTEFSILKDLYQQIIQNNIDNKEIIKLLDRVLPEFELYKENYSEMQEKQKLMQLKESKITLYKKLWDKQNIFYKLIHRNENPNKNNLAEMDIALLDTKLEKLDKKSR